MPLLATHNNTPSVPTTSTVTPIHNAKNSQENATLCRIERDKPSKSEKILSVEDNRVNQEGCFQVMLTKAGYAFEIADNGQIAVDMYQNDSSFDIILMIAWCWYTVYPPLWDS